MLEAKLPVPSTKRRYEAGGWGVLNESCRKHMLVRKDGPLTRAGYIQAFIIWSNGATRGARHLISTCSRSPFFFFCAALFTRLNLKKVNVLTKQNRMKNNNKMNVLRSNLFVFFPWAMEMN